MIINILVVLSIIFYVSPVLSVSHELVASQNAKTNQTKPVEKTVGEEIIRKVGDLKFTTEADKITLVVPIDGSIRRSVSVIKGNIGTISKTPTQLILDLYPAELKTKTTTITVNKGVITQVSLSELKDKSTKTVRITLNLVTLTPYEISDDIGKVTLKITTPVTAGNSVPIASKTPTTTTGSSVSKVPKKTTQTVVVVASPKTTIVKTTVAKAPTTTTSSSASMVSKKTTQTIVAVTSPKTTTVKTTVEKEVVESTSTQPKKIETDTATKENGGTIETEVEKSQVPVVETTKNNSVTKENGVPTKTAAKPVIIAIDGISKDSLNQRITMDLQGADLVTVVRTLVEQSGYNLVISKSVAGTVSVRLKEVPLEKALALILGMNGYTYSIEENMNMVRIATQDELLTEQEKTMPITQIFTLNFTKPSIVSPIVSSVLSSKGKIQVDDRTNSLIISDAPSKLQKVEDLLKKIDTMTPQVMIEAKIVEVNVTSTDKFGINWIMASGQARKTSTVQTADTGAVFPDIASPKGEIPRADTKIQIAPPQTAGSAANLQFGTIAKDLNIVMLLDFLISNNDANLLANPKILTLNNQLATINIAQVYSYISAYNQQTGIPTYATVDAGISLSVTPQINANNYVTIKIAPSVSSVVEIGPPPVIAKRDTNTEVRVKDGETIVIGGLIREDEVVTVNKVPVLGDIPLINFLFKSKTTSKQKRDLMIFITPHLIQ